MQLWTLEDRRVKSMNLAELNVQEEWAYYNKVAPFQVYKMNDKEVKY